MQYVFYAYSTSQFGLATFQIAACGWCCHSGQHWNQWSYVILQHKKRESRSSQKWLTWWYAKLACFLPVTPETWKKLLQESQMLKTSNILDSRSGQFLILHLGTCRSGWKVSCVYTISTLFPLGVYVYEWWLRRGRMQIMGRELNPQVTPETGSLVLRLSPAVILKVSHTEGHRSCGQRQTWELLAPAPSLMH